ncbi:MAG: YkgJ family cysteine cluster protein, partial [Chloroflexi bacterium]|nr:YkgJ family cysteine cluster protein [Chloroflexota bacterium]
TIEQYERKGEQAWVMHATPCGFLNKANLCGIYKDRPYHCSAFPDTLRDWCPLSSVLFPELLPNYRRPADQEPKRRARSGVRRRPVAEPTMDATPEQ